MTRKWSVSRRPSRRGVEAARVTLPEVCTARASNTFVHGSPKNSQRTRGATTKRCQTHHFVVKAVASRRAYHELHGVRCEKTLHSAPWPSQRPPHVARSLCVWGLRCPSGSKNNTLLPRHMSSFLEPFERKMVSADKKSWTYPCRRSLRSKSVTMRRSCCWGTAGSRLDSRQQSWVKSKCWTHERHWSLV